MTDSTGSKHRQYLVFGLAAGLYLAATLIPWFPDEAVRRATGLVLATLTLWISEVAPLGVVAMAIPIAATFTGILPWKEALTAWSDPVVFLFLGAFLLARALDKHGVFDWILRVRWSGDRGSGSGAGMCIVVLLISGTLSTLQNNTAVCAMMLPVTVALAKKVRAPYAVLLALAWGATFGGMATPVGTAPNFIGYAAMKKLDPAITFLSWLRVGVPVWIGTTLIGWGVLAASIKWSRHRASRHVPTPSNGPQWLEPFVVTDVGPERPTLNHASKVPANRAVRGWALVLFSLAVLLWIIPGVVISATDTNHPAAIFFRMYLPESLVPLGVAWIMFVLPVGREGRPLLDRHDFQSLDWDTLFLIAGGMSLGKLLETSGAADALAHAVAVAQMRPVFLMVGLAGVTVLLSELTSNTATASLMVPIAGSLAQSLDVSPVNAIWLVALAASLGFALPVSTPPNAIVYGTRLIPLRIMALTGIAVDILSVIWLVCCMQWLKN